MKLDLNEVSRRLTREQALILVLFKDGSGRMIIKQPSQTARDAMLNSAPNFFEDPKGLAMTIETALPASPAMLITL